MIAERSITHGESRIDYGGGERPKYASLRHTIDAFYRDLLRPLTALELAVTEALKLPVEKAEEKKPFRYTARQRRVLDKAIDVFLTEIAGPDRSRAGFVEGGMESDTPDGILQQREILSYSVGLQRAGDLLERKTTLTPGRADPAVREMLDGAFARLSENGTLRLESVRDDIHGILVSGTDAGISPLDVGRQLSRQFDQYGSYEFERLARTEAAFAAIAGNREQMTEFGVGYVIWLLDASACPLCQAYEGKVFSVEDTANHPPLHPNCLCDLSPAG